MPFILRAFATSLILMTATALPLAAQQDAAPPPSPPTVEEKPAPYDAQLSRLAEVLGSLPYLRFLCGAEEGDWRNAMSDLLDADTAGEPRRRARLTAAFNRGYRSFASIQQTFPTATPPAEERDRTPGETR